MSEPKKPATIVAAAHPDLDPLTEASAPAIWTSDTFRWDSPDDKPAFDYSRTVNPNRAMLVADACGAGGRVRWRRHQQRAVRGAAGFARLPAGARVVAPHDCYGGTFRLLRGLEDQGKLRCTFVDQTDDGAFESATAEEFALLWIETPSNPLLRVTDIRKRAAAAKSAAHSRLPTTPCFRRAGRSRSTSAATWCFIRRPRCSTDMPTCSAARFSRRIRRWSKSSNGGPTPPASTDRRTTSSQIVRGLRTLPLRVDRQEQSAIAIAEWLAARPEVRDSLLSRPKVFSRLRNCCSATIRARFLLSFELQGRQGGDGQIRQSARADHACILARRLLYPRVHSGLDDSPRNASGSAARSRNQP